MLGDRINKLRKKHNMTQQALADILKITRQAVHNWEQNISLPDAEKISAMSRIFETTSDYILELENIDPAQALPEPKDINPNYAEMHWWEVYSLQLGVEYQQCVDQGLDIAHLEPVMKAIREMQPSEFTEQMADAIFKNIRVLNKVQGYEFKEPDDIKSITLLRTWKQPYGYKPLDKKVLEDRIRAAWTGRICGCLLGKTVEGIKTDELVPLLKETGNYPMHRYIKRSDMTEKIYSKYKFNLKERVYADEINAAPVDDDTNYTVLSSLIVDKYTDQFDSSHVLKTWLDLQPKRAYCTAERVAYINATNGLTPPDTALYKNPYREWIGAQIRIDYYGYINPGTPRKAAYMAWKDARVSHFKNGIYSSMFIAAIIAVAPYCDNILDAIKYGLNHIPATSRLYKSISDIVKEYEKGMDEKQAFADIHAKYDEFSAHDWCHAISNTCVVVTSLIYGKNDFSKSICLAVQAGFDTDCNGATVGSIVGMQKGMSAINPEWIKPINNKLETSVFGVGTVTIDQLVETTMQHVTEYSPLYVPGYIVDITNHGPYKEGILI